MNSSWIGQLTSHIKIPTLLALILLTFGLVGGVYLTTTGGFTNLKTQADISTAPKNITVSNLSDTTAAIYWQTNKATTGFIQLGINSDLGQNFQDDRDQKVPSPHTLHFVTLSNLLPATTYYYKITSGGQTYPSGNPATFTTLTTIPYQGYSPLVGKILDQKLQPVPEALVILEIPGGQTIATITKLAGNFMLPLSYIRTTDLLHVFSWNQKGTVAKLKISDNNQSSEVRIFLDGQGNQITSTASALTPIILGKNLDLVPK